MARKAPWIWLCAGLMGGPLSGGEPQSALPGPEFRKPAEAETPAPEAGKKTEWQFSLDSRFQYLEGTFGTQSRTKVRDFSVGLSAYRDRFDLSVSQSRLDVKTSGPATTVGPDGLPVPDGAQGRTTRHTSGLGDLSLGAGYQVFRQSEAGFGLSVGAGVKIPTADPDTGLGTGEYDYSLRVGLSRRVDDWVGSLGVGRVFVGDPPGRNFRDLWTQSASVGRRFPVDDERDFTLRVVERAETAAVSGANEPVELGLRGTYMTERWMFSLEWTAGVTDAAPDYRISFGVGYEF